MNVRIVEFRPRMIAFSAIALAASLCQWAAAQSADVVISQFYGGGGNTGAPYRSDYVELFNRGCVPVDISNWSIQQASSTGTAWNRTNLPQGTVLQPGQYFLVSFAAGTTGTAPFTVLNADATAACGTTGTGPGSPSASMIDFSATAGKCALVRNQNTLPAVTCPTAANGVVDLLSFGTGSSPCEGAVAPAPSNTTALFRAGGGCIDTNVNSADFTVGAPAPRNSASPFNVCGPVTPASGACQFADGTCQVLTAADCGTAGGAYMGDCTQCSDRGACCLPDGTCVSVQLSRCTVLGGTFGGPGSRCYTATLTSTALEDISATGTIVTGSNTDDTTTAAQALPFTFFYYGTAKTSFVLNPNGWISFDPTAPGSTAGRGHHILPNSFAPNDFLAPYWDDLNNSTSNNIRAETRGTTPFRRHIIQWTAVPQFSGGGPNTFQIILYETTNCFEFRYGTIQPHEPVASATSNVTFSAGFENAAGTTGEHINSFSLGSGGATVSRLYCPLCVPPASGACCFINGTCSTQTEAGCNAAGGAYQGDSTDCSICPPGGACCFADGSCLVRTELVCLSLGGAYQGDGTNCGSVIYPPPATWPEGFEDIRPIGTLLTFATQDDSSAPVNLPFTYFHYGVAKTNGLVSTNGYLTFSASGTTLTNDAIPTAALPNDSLYVLWDDLHLRSVGTVHVATLGAAPYRRYIVQWTDIDQFSPSNPANVMTFQIKIYETSNCVEYHYLNIVPETPAGDYTIGVENSTGTAATAFPGAGIGNGHIRIVFCPDGLTCPQPTGACCRDNGACEIRTYGDCLEVCGTYQGDGTTCDPGTCPPGGACCFLDGGCVILTAAACLNQGGIPQGDGTTCDPNPCPQPTGACCYLDGSCLEQTSADCATGGGTYQGNFSVCTPNPCPQPTGACCFTDGSCQELTSAACATAGGAYQGNFSVCTPNPCPQPTGACCYLDGSCLEQTSADCATGGGTY
ncbi:MAG: lamin tail domain-containing protein, partial [Phycisphaerales bacterium]|nr:lamin tail domain-containing protein [Phycisphaerales bacterium]